MEEILNEEERKIAVRAHSHCYLNNFDNEEMDFSFSWKRHKTRLCQLYRKYAEPTTNPFADPLEVPENKMIPFTLDVVKLYKQMIHPACTSEHLPFCNDKLILELIDIAIKDPIPIYVLTKVDVETGQETQEFSEMNINARQDYELKLMWENRNDLDVLRYEVLLHSFDQSFPISIEQEKTEWQKKKTRSWDRKRLKAEKDYFNSLNEDDKEKYVFQNKHFRQTMEALDENFVESLEKTAEVFDPSHWD